MRNIVPEAAAPYGVPGGRMARIRRAPVATSIWLAAPTIAILLIVIVAVRLHEFVPMVRIVKPALLATFGGLAILLANSTDAARTAALRHPLMRLLLAYFGFIVLTVPFAMYSAQAFGIVRYFFPGVVLLLAILLCPPDFRTVRRLQIGLVVAAIVYALYTNVSGRVSPTGRLSAGMGMYDSNDMAALLAMCFPLAAGLVASRRSYERIAWCVGALVLAVVVINSGSRGGMLGLGAGALVLALGLRGRFRVGALATLAVTTLLLWNFSPTFNARMSTLANLDDDYNTTMETGRKQVWKRGRGYIRENPIVGVGAGNFPIAEGEFFKAYYMGTRGAKWSAAHNAYVQAYAELGLLGGSLFVSLLGFGVIRGLRLRLTPSVRGAPRVHRPEFLASLCAFMVSAIFLSHAYFLPLVALLGLIALADRAASVETAGRMTGAVPVHNPGRRRLRVGALPPSPGGLLTR
jgi:O-antigen ligase